MTSPSSNKSTALVTSQRVQIRSVDPVGHTATATTRYGTTVTINTQFNVGAVHVVPAVNEMWFVQRIYGGTWVLDRRLPFSDNTLANVVNNPVQGTVQVGSAGVGTQGPLNLMGSIIAAMAPLQLDSFLNTDFPAPAACVGSLIWDATDNQVMYSTGTAWEAFGTGGGSGVSGATVIGETPTGTQNGTNETFTTAQHFVASSTEVYRNGIREKRGSSYTETTPNTLVFTTAPLSDDVVTVDYIIGT